MNELGLSNLSLSDVSAVASVVIEEVESSGLRSLKDLSAFADIQNELHILDNEMERFNEKDSEYDNNEALKRRDDAYVGFRKIVSALTYSPEPGVKDYAFRLYALLNMHGAGIERLSEAYDKDFLRNILIQIREPINIRLVEELKIKPYLETLELCEREFQQMKMLVDEERDAFRQSVRVTEQRRKVEATVIAFFNSIGLQATYGTSNKEKFQELEKAIYNRYTSIRLKYSNSRLR